MPLASGSRIGRIRVEALLGSGGMGEVWRGFDEKLERPVALKIVHADKRFSAAMRGRFLREARLLSKLDHPNICRIYDVLERDDGDYLVLELVEGTTLRKRAPELSKERIVEIALQVARVLAATHARGIIHRDLKPDNIMLTPSGEVKVLDFGLARAVGDDAHESLPVTDFATDDQEKTAVLGSPISTTAPEASQTVAGSLVGTLQYMSPEQARGLPLSPASDIYSLGIVLHELLSRRRAYDDETAQLNDLLVRVRTAGVTPFDFRDRDVTALLARMLKMHPGDRPEATEVVRALEAIRDRPARRKRHLAIAAAVVAIVLLIGGAFLASRYVGAPRRLSGARLAILPFENATGDRSLSWVELGLAELVADGLSRAKGADVVRPEAAARAMKNLSIKTGALTDAQRRRLLGVLGADVLIAPAVASEDGGKYTIRYAALTANGAEPPRESTSSVLIEAAKQMSVALAQRIDPASSTSSVRERYSLDNTANLLYAMSRDELRTRGPRIAAHYLQVCLDRDPGFLAAKVELAACHQTMGDRAPAERLMNEAIAAARQRNDEPMLIKAQLALASWNVEWGNYDLAQRGAGEALRVAQKLGDRQQLGAVQTMLGEVALRRGDLPRAKSLFESALATFTASGNQHRQADLYNSLGLIAHSAGDEETARKRFGDALAIADRLNDRLIGATVIGNYALVEGDRGNFPRAIELTRRQIALTREIGDHTSEIFGLANLGLWLWATGREEEAIRATEDALRRTQTIGNPRVEAILLSNLATASAKRGDLPAARKWTDLALARNRGLNDPEVERDVYLGLAYTLIREGRLREAADALTRAEQWQPNGRTMLMRGRLAYALGAYGEAFARIKAAKAQNEAWLMQNEQMYRAFEESARTGRAAGVVFEGVLR